MPAESKPDGAERAGHATQDLHRPAARYVTAWRQNTHAPPDAPRSAGPEPVVVFLTNKRNR